MIRSLAIFCLCVPSLVLAQETTDIDELVAGLTADDVEVRRDAAYGLAALGEQAADATDALIGALDDRDSQVWSASVQALARIGPKAAVAVPALVKNLENRDAQRRYRSAHALGSIGAPAEAALLQSLQSPVSRIRASAAKATQFMQSVPDEIVNLLIAALDDTDDVVRDQVIESLGKADRQRESVLCEAARTGTPRSQSGALRALAAMQWHDAETLSLLESFMEHESDVVRGAVVMAAGRGKDPGGPAIAIVVHGLKDSTDTVRAVALTAVLDHGSDAAEAVTTLAELVSSTNPQTRTAAARALSRIGAASQAALPELLDQLTDDAAEEGPQRAIIRAIGRVGPTVVPALLQRAEVPQAPFASISKALAEVGPSALPALLTALDQSGDGARVVAIEALGRLEVSSPERADRLQAQLASESSVIRAAAARALGMMRQEAGTARDTLLEHLNDESAGVRAAILTALPAIGAVDDRFEAAIQVALEDSDTELRRSAVAALLTTQLPSEEIAKGLESVIDDVNAAVREQVVRGLASLGGEQSAATDLLVAALSDPEPTVRAAAASGLAEFGSAASSAGDELGHLLEDPSERVVLAALRAIAVIGTASASQETVIGMLKDESSEIRAGVAAAARFLIDDESQVVELLSERLDDEDWLVRKAATLNLGEIGAASKPAVPKLFQLLNSPEDSSAARSAIREIDAVGPEALPFLVKGLTSENRRIRYYAVYLLGQLGPEAEEVLPMLREVESGSRRFNESIARAIAKIEGREEPEEKKDR
jgi:HEAT repeat protein